MRNGNSLHKLPLILLAGNNTNVGKLCVCNADPNARCGGVLQRSGNAAPAVKNKIVCGPADSRDGIGNAFFDCAIPAGDPDNTFGDPDDISDDPENACGDYSNVSGNADNLGGCASDPTGDSENTCGGRACASGNPGNPLCGSAGAYNDLDNPRDDSFCDRGNLRDDH